MESEKPTISVIIPTYNSSAYIVRTLDTVLSQTVLPDEIVIVDDGSTDNTVQTIKDYKEKNKDILENIYVFRQENMGAGAARNRAIEEATGEWIAFLDSDDLWDSHKLEIVAEAIYNHPEVNMIAHDEYSVQEKDLENKTLCSLHENYKPDEDLFLQLYRGNIFSTSCMVVKKEILLKAGGFDVTLKSAQDYDMWIRCGLYGKLYFIDKALETYVIRPGNITANTYRRYKCEMKICRKYTYEIMKKAGAKDGTKIIRDRIWMIHKVETYLALRKGQVATALKILCQLPVALFRKNIA